MVGRKVGQYQFLEKLGAGGMGEIYKAQDTRLGRVVAIKVLPSARSGDPERRRRFLQEAQAASGLNHPSIIVIHDIVSEGDTEYMVMEYVAGKTLNDLIPKGGLRVPQALKYALQISDALNVAHAAGIVHRDLKPANIMVTDSGLVKVLDFGLAKLTDRGTSLTQLGEDAETIAATSPMTVEGSILGTVSYMSPEQAQGKKVDTRSDIFSFGAVFYEMLTGRRAFEGESSLSTLSSILRDDVRPMIEVAPDVPPQLEAVIQQCLRKMPDDRWQTMREVQAALSVLKRESDSGSLYGSRLAVSAMPASAGAGPASAASAAHLISGVAPPSGFAQNMPPGPPTGTGPVPTGVQKKLPIVPIAIGVVILLVAGGAGIYVKQQATHRAQLAAKQAADEAAAKAAADQAAADAAAQAAEAAKLAEETVNNDSIVELVTAKVPTAAILDHIREAKVTNFNFSTAEIIRLSKAGVSATIMDQMRNPKRVLAAPAPAPVVAKAVPAPPPGPTRPAVTPAPSSAPAPTPAPAEPTPTKAATAPPPTPAPAPTPQTVAVTVPDGMPFRIVLTADIPANVDLGLPVKFTLPEDFKVNGVTVLPKGATVSGEISETAGKKKFMNLVGGTKLSFTLSKARGAGNVNLSVRSLSARRADGATQRPVDTGKGGNKTVAAPQGTEYIGYVDGEQTINVPK
jgi:serine/threonine protein kinase